MESIPILTMLPQSIVKDSTVSLSTPMLPTMEADRCRQPQDLRTLRRRLALQSLRYPPTSKTLYRLPTFSVLLQVSGSTFNTSTLRFRFTLKSILIFCLTLSTFDRNGTYRR